MTFGGPDPALDRQRRKMALNGDYPREAAVTSRLFDPADIEGITETGRRLTETMNDVIAAASDDVDSVVDPAETKTWTTFIPGAYGGYYAGAAVGWGRHGAASYSPDIAAAKLMTKAAAIEFRKVWGGKVVRIVDGKVVK